MLLRNEQREVIRNNRKHLKPLSRCLRFQLSMTGMWHDFPIGVKEAMLKENPDIEVYWHPQRQTWEVYTILARKSGADDVLIHEFTLRYPPGIWLVNHLRENDVYNRVNIKKDIIVDLEIQEDKKEEESQRTFDNFLLSVKEDERMILRGRDSIVVPRNIKEVLV